MAKLGQSARWIDTPAAGDETLDGVRRRRFAAAGELGESFIDADDEDALIALRRVCSVWSDFVGAGFGVEIDALGHRLELARFISPRAAAIEVVGPGMAELVGEIVEVGAGLAQALQFLGDDTAPFGQGFFQGEVGKPLAHLDPGALGLDVAPGGVEPVAGRAAVLGRDDFDPLAGFQRRIERYQLAVDLGAAAAMAEVGVHPVGEIHRRRAGRWSTTRPWGVMT